VVTYPLNDADVSDAAVVAALADAGLGHLAGELATVDTWERRLSGGEQQMLAIARVLLVRPDWLFLDEATSNLDRESAARLYALLQDRLPGTTFVSIAHRRDVARFHSRVLHIEHGEARIDGGAVDVEAV
jgi:vitamin B12/bleomycin/antimicrobial peptide transport system ATP-binding/permease protein